mmetsp:Transcript_34712/g.80201  ORF Transcript_34712/g.80201 Transcript_34712/m.80201 type:complete len:125 (-) Transcript_34712:718-1092(-)
MLGVPRSPTKAPSLAQRTSAGVTAAPQAPPPVPPPAVAPLAPPQPSQPPQIPQWDAACQFPRLVINCSPTVYVPTGFQLVEEVSPSPAGVACCMVTSLLIFPISMLGLLLSEVKYSVVPIQRQR